MKSPMINRLRVAVIHGAYGSPEENWFPWLIGELRSRGIDAIAPSFPTPQGQSLSAWRDQFADHFGDLDGSSILVGHSLGSTFILDLLECAKTPILASFLVSGFVSPLGLPEFDAINKPFFDRRFDWRRIRENSRVFRVYNGDNDPYVPLVQGVEIAKNLGVELEVVKGGGHINSSAGFTTFPQLLDDIIKVTKLPQAR